MTPEQGAADLLRALSPYAWPVAVVVLALIFRRPIYRLIDRIRGARYKRGDTEMTVILDRVELDAETVLPVNEEIRARLPRVAPRR
jgi:hypothetical protein